MEQWSAVVQLLGRDSSDGLFWQRGGLLRGDRVFNAVGQLLKINDIAECALKFGAVTTNLSTGRELWLTEGDIHQAVRASCSMLACWRRCGPTAVAAGWRGGQSGAGVPLPGAGADIVIAVDLQHDAHLMQQDLFSVRVRTSSDDAPADTGAGV